MFTVWIVLCATIWFLKHLFMWKAQRISLESIASTSLVSGEGGEKNLGYQPRCRNSSRYSAWSSDPEGAGGSKDASVHSSLWCKAEAQLSCQVNLKIQVFPKPQKEHSWAQPNSDMSVLWVLTLPHIRVTLPLCKGFFFAIVLLVVSDPSGFLSVCSYPGLQHCQLTEKTSLLSALMWSGLMARF